jgi:hypothetical protein
MGHLTNDNMGSSFSSSGSPPPSGVALVSGDRAGPVALVSCEGEGERGGSIRDRGQWHASDRGEEAAH